MRSPDPLTADLWRAVAWFAFWVSMIVIAASAMVLDWGVVL